jgi:hypothetical protein
MRRQTRETAAEASPLGYGGDPETSRLTDKLLSDPLVIEAARRLSTHGLEKAQLQATASSKQKRAAYGTQVPFGLLDEENCLLRAVRQEIMPHVEAARELPHPLSSVPTAGQPPELVEAIHHTAGFASDPPALLEQREAFLADLKRCQPTSCQ